MKRHPELERTILLAIEADERGKGDFIDLSSIDGYSDYQTDYHCRLLFEAGLIAGVETANSSHPFRFTPTRLTMAGHQYLDSIRDPEIWRRTQEGARQVGSFGLDVLGALAKAYLRERLQALTGFDMPL